MEALSSLKLVILKGPRDGETLEFNSGSTVRIGRVVRGNNLTIKDSGISSKHLIISFESDKWVIRDLDSSNGTVLNDFKLSPNVPVDLNDGDSIKVGEYTSISVQIGCNVVSNLRRNPRRGVVEESVGFQGRGGRGVKESGVRKVVEEEDGRKLENSAVVVGVEEKRMRARPRRARVLKGEVVEDLCELPKIDENLENVCPVEAKEQSRISTRARSIRNELDMISGVKVMLNGKLDNVAAEGAVLVMENKGRGRRGRPRVLKSEVEDEICEIQKVQANAGVARLMESNQESQVMTRRTRSKKNEKNLSSNLTNIKIEQAPSLHCREEETEGRKTQGGTRSNLQEKSSTCAPVRVLKDNENVEGANLGDTTQINVREGRENAEVLTSGEEIHKRVSGCGITESSNKVEMRSTSGVRQSSSKTLEVPNLEKMTLQEWFDYMEVHLRKQIIDDTEELIENMRQKAKAVHEYRVQQINEKRTQHV